MVVSDSVQKFFDEVDAKGGVVVRETPKFDLDLYIGSYKGRTRLDRLLHIGRTSVPLCTDALKAAIAEAKQHCDTGSYEEALGCLRMAAPDDPDAQADKDWVAETKKNNLVKVKQLEFQLSEYRHNLIRESIRIGNEELGKFHEEIGELTTAQDFYTRTRPDASLPQHIAETGRNLVRIAILRKDWPAAHANLTKISASGGDDKKVKAYSDIVKGICKLGLGHYEAAARDLLRAGAIKSHSEYDEIASPNDVAVYAGLLSLATMNREELVDKVLGNPTSRTFFEHEPYIRKAVSMFATGRYKACLASLEAHHPDYLLDIYLQRHVPVLLEKIRVKCIVAYCHPFSCASLSVMQDEFGSPGRKIVHELKRMIRSGQLGNYRIDAAEGYLVDVSPSPRLAAFRELAEVTDDFATKIRGRHFIMNAHAAGLEVNSTTPGVVKGSFGDEELSRGI